MITSNKHFRTIDAISICDHRACNEMRKADEASDYAIPIELFMVPHERAAATHRAWNVALHYARQQA